MEAHRRIVAWLLALAAAAAWTGSALAAPLPRPLAQRIEAACQQASQAGLMAKVEKVEKEDLPTLAEAPCPQVRAASIYALGEVRDAGAVPLLVGHLNDEDKAVRRISARALGKIGDPAAAEPLIAVLQNRQEPLAVRCVAARALGMFSDLEAARALLRAAKAENGALQASAENALHNMKGFLELKGMMALN